ncbi:MAG: deoxyribodipyrimidine photo-lyase [Halothiobacillaceae bacterium]
MNSNILQDTAIWWIRRDLRLSDNPALLAAAQHQRLIALYIHEPMENLGDELGAASAWWLHHSLLALDQDLRQLGSSLTLRSGHAHEVLDSLIASASVSAVYWNRQYAPAQLARDSKIKLSLRERGLRVESFNAHLLLEPWQNTRSGQAYKVFTPFWKACLNQGIDHTPSPAPTQLPPTPPLVSAPIETLRLLPSIPWDTGLRSTWNVGERAAWQQLQTFLQKHLNNYPEGRNLPAQPGSSRLSPHLAFGEISPRQIIQAVRNHQHTQPNTSDEAVRIFISELGWREFGYHLLFHFPKTQHEPLNPRWDVLKWPDVEPAYWQAWIRGQTGIPLVDAGMRELWHTGWMHNRVRMNAASLLVKNMLIPWQHGERWFSDTLVDFDLASNVQGWQWTAGCGADAAPYFRVFNPTLQGEKFDPNGDYIRRWLPEIASLPHRWIHRPWEAPALVLQGTGIKLGVHYPKPIVDLANSRQRALTFFSQLKASTSET